MSLYWDMQLLIQYFNTFQHSCGKDSFLVIAQLNYKIKRDFWETAEAVRLVTVNNT